MPKISKRSPTKQGGFVGHGGFVPAPPTPRLKTGKTYPYASAKRGVLPPGMAAAILDPEERRQASRAIYEKLRTLKDADFADVERRFTAATANDPKWKNAP